MSLSARLLRPLLRPSSAVAQFRSMATKPVTARLQSGKTKPEAQPQRDQLKMILMAGMPQMVPFYWVNEVAATFIIIPTLIYLFSKYWLPQNVRAKMARLYISRL